MKVVKSFEEQFDYLRNYKHISIEKMNKFNLCYKDIDYYLLSESYKNII